MTIFEAEKFYEQDEKKYELINNKDFLAYWRENQDKIRFNAPYYTIDEFQNLINYLVLWYEIKYPDYEFYDDYEKREVIEKGEFSSLVVHMGMKELLERLNYVYRHIIFCNYGGYNAKENEKLFFSLMDIRTKKNWIKLWGKDEIDEDNLKHYEYILNNYPDSFWLNFNSYNGNVCLTDENNKELLQFLDLNLKNETSISLEDAYILIKEKDKYHAYDEEHGMYKLQGSIKWHNYDLEFRDKLLPLVPLAILYSKNSHPDAGYERAKKFIEEFNNEFGLDLKTDEIDEIMHRDYNIDKHPIAKNFVKKIKEKIKIPK